MWHASEDKFDIRGYKFVCSDGVASISIYQCCDGDMYSGMLTIWCEIQLRFSSIDS